MNKLIVIFIIFVFCCMYAIAYGADEDNFKIVEFESKHSDGGVYRDYPDYNWANYWAYQNDLMFKDRFKPMNLEKLDLNVYYLKDIDKYAIVMYEHAPSPLTTYDKWKEFKAELKYSFTLGSGKKSRTKVYYHESKLVVENRLYYSGAFLYPIAKSYYDSGDRRLTFNVHYKVTDGEMKLDLKGMKIQIEPELFVKMRENEKEHWKAPKLKSSK